MPRSTSKDRAEVVAVAGDGGDTTYDKRRRLAAELRLLRDLNGMAGRELARRIGISQSKISRIESGAVLPSIAEVTAWTRAVGAAEETRRLLELLTEAARTEVITWQAALEGRPQLQDEIREQEAAAARIRAFTTAVVPGLLQTSAYAQRLFPMLKKSYPQTSVAAAVAARMDRQLALYEEGKAFEFIITEAALRWRPGPPRLLAAQLDRIATVSTLDNVSVGVIPFAKEAETLYSHDFTIHEGEGADSAPFVLVETDHAGLTVTAADDVAMYQDRWSALRKAARFEDEARAFLGELIAELRAMAG